MADALLWNTKGLRKRRNVLTQQLTAGICDAIVLGMHEIDAARALGLPRSTLNDWKKRGEHEPDSIYEQFADCISQAISIRNKVLVDNIKEKSEGDENHKPDWRADAWLLQRQSREIYGDNPPPMDDQKQVTAANFSQSNMDGRLSEDEKRTLEALLTKLAGEEATAATAGFAGSVQQLPVKGAAE